MPVFFHDTFTDTNGTLLTAHTADSGVSWGFYPGYSDPGAIDTGRSTNTDGTNYCFAVADGFPAAADYRVESTIRRMSAVSGSWDVMLRADDTVASGSDTYYYAAYDGGGGTLTFNKAVAGVFTQLSSASLSWTNGQDRVIRIDLLGTAYTVYADGVQQFTGNDSAITAAGKIGLGSAVENSPGLGFHADVFTGSTASSLMLRPPMNINLRR